jgi:predicted dithiol-disulfide oxidoreductase (DUF899 family)
MTDHQVASREEWLAARADLLAREKEHTRIGDDLARARRQLPWVRVDKEYSFEASAGIKTLKELFDGRSRLLVYHFMFGPSYEAGCPVCSSSADSVNGALAHLEARDATMVYVSRAPLAPLEAYKERMGWRFPWVSSADSDFNLDFGMSQTREQASRLVDSMGEGMPPVLTHMADTTGTDVAGVPDRGARVQHLRSRPGRRLPHLFHHGAWPGVPDGVLPDPGPGSEGSQRIGLDPGVDSPPRRVRAFLVSGLA